MAIELGYPIGQMLDEPENAILDHRTAVIQTEQMIVGR
jgi:hypothetical protein